MLVEPFITSREAANLLGISLRTVQLWVENKVLRAWKTAGGHRRVVLSSVEDLIRQQQQAINGTNIGANMPVVLVVEDNQEMRNLYEGYFKRWKLPLTLMMATNGFEGLIQIGQQNPSLAIVDLNMPGMDGFQMIRALKENSERDDMELIVVTGLSEKEIEQGGGLPDGVKLMQKPIKFSDLQALLLEKLLLELPITA